MPPKMFEKPLLLFVDEPPLLPAVLLTLVWWLRPGSKLGWGRPLESRACWPS